MTRAAESTAKPIYLCDGIPSTDNGACHPSLADDYVGGIGNSYPGGRDHEAN